VKTIVTIMTVALIVGGCATGPSGAARAPVAVDLGWLAGTWSGALTSHEMVNANGIVEAPARVTIAEDGHWRMTSSGGAVAEGSTHQTSGGIEMRGRVTSGDPMTVGRDVVFTLKADGRDALFGEGETFYLGHRIDSALLLRRS
jgi:hypothetical protein